MRKPPIPIDESARVESLKRLAVLDTMPEDRFDRVTRLVAKSFDVPIAAIGFVDTDRQWFKSKIGISVSEISRDVSFCAHGIADLQVGNSDYRIFAVPDAHKDERFVDNPLVTGPPHIRAYAGFILQSEDKHNIGALCVIDHQPRYFSENEQQTLADYGMVVENMLHSLRYEQHDTETDLYNRRGLCRLIEYMVKAMGAYEYMLSAASINLLNFSEVAEKNAHMQDKEILENFISSLQRTFRSTDAIARLAPDQFVVLSKHDKRIDFGLGLERFKEHFDQVNARLPEELQLRYHADFDSYPSKSISSCVKLLEKLDKKLAKDKKDYQMLQ